MEVLADPANYAPLGIAARRTIEDRYTIESCIPPLKEFFERVAAGGNTRVEVQRR